METKTLIFSTIIALLLAGLSAGVYVHYETLGEVATLKSKVATLSSDLNNEKQTNTELSDQLFVEKNKNDEFEAQINEIADTVGVLDKLSKTDEELLKKYSKVYFLNENYVPEFITGVAKQFIYPETKEVEIHGKVYSYLKDLLEDASGDGLSLKVTSGYRSFGTQTSLKSNYTVVYGSGANTFSADQGYSEHQLGTTVDFTTPTVGVTFVGFEKTEEYKWLLNNAYKYGFTLSYPEGNAYYQYEPWHWRFVGVDLAKRLSRNGEHFYDLDQRTIDQYLVNIFD